MKKALVNYWVDMVTGVAFLFCAITGIVRLFPETTTLTASGTPAILGISTALWATIHDWSGALMAAGVGVHTVLHLRWLTHMTRRIAGGDAKRKARVVPAGGRGTARVPATAVAAAAVAGENGAWPATAPRVVAAAELQRLERHWENRGRENAHRHTRKTFLTGAAAVGGVALLVGLGLAGRDAASGLLDRSAEQAPTDAVSWEGQAEPDDSSYGSASQDSGAATSSDGTSSSDGSSSGATASGSSSSDGTTGSTARVAVDSGSCVGCGACLQVCPDAVFASSGGVVTAQYPDACRLCGRCTQVCRPGAITLTA
jgi:Pyruvate/2-oxoacid:ferredoxin oxidoreductase delta subunit